jgi:hypothetical protein
MDDGGKQRHQKILSRGIREDTKAGREERAQQKTSKREKTEGDGEQMHSDEN